LGHYALAVRIRQQPYDNRRAGHAAAGRAGAALLIHYPLEDAMRNLTATFIAAFMLFAVPAAAQKPGQTATRFATFADRA